MKTKEDLIKMGFSDFQIRLYLPPPKNFRMPTLKQTTKKRDGKTVTKSKTVYQYIEGWEDGVVTKNLDHLRKYTVINI